MVISQTGKLGSFRRDPGGATAVNCKGRDEKSDPRAGSGAARGAKTNAMQTWRALCRHADLLR